MTLNIAKYRKKFFLRALLIATKYMIPSPQRANIADPTIGQSAFAPTHYEQALPLPLSDDIDTVDYYEIIKERR